MSTAFVMIEPGPVAKTRAEQRLDWLEHVGRPLTMPESDEVRRCLHAIYCRNRRLANLARVTNESAAETLAKDAQENKKLLKRVLRESQRRER